jgi:hypothetical protein
MAICCDIFNRSTINSNGQREVHFENKGLLCKQFQNFNGIVLVVNGKFACQEETDFDLLHNNEWIDTACTMFSTKLWNQLKSIDDLAFIRHYNLVDNGRYHQVEVEGKVVVVERQAFARHENNLGNLMKVKSGQHNFVDGQIAKNFKVNARK